MFLVCTLGMLASLATAFPATETIVLPPTVINGSSTIVQEVGQRPLDGAYITNPNSTSYEWWYFDALASDLSSSVVFQPILTYSSTPATIFSLTLSYPNDTWSILEVPVEKLYFSSNGEGSAAIAADGSFGWRSASDLSEYTLTLDLEEQGVTGDIHLSSIAPPHVACGAAVPGADLVFNWDLLWVNLVPDAVASVNLNVNGTAIAFEGSGYHDKNWGGMSFTYENNQWYWGHGRAGNYSVVWFYLIDDSGNTIPSAYIAQDGEILYTACTNDEVTVRPYGAGVEYPIPTNATVEPEGVTINVDAGSLGKFAFTTTKTQTVETLAIPYSRWIGNITGGLSGEANVTGFALWEQMGPF